MATSRTMFQSRLPDALARDATRIQGRAVPRHTRLAFLATEVRVRVGSKWRPTADVAKRLGTPLQILTAWNPLGKAQTDADNSANNRRLKRDLLALTDAVYPAVGESLNGDWHEDGFAVVAQSNKTLRELAWAYGQLAIFSINYRTITVLGTRGGNWQESRPIQLAGWQPKPESSDNLADAIASATGWTPVVAGAGTDRVGWLLEDGVGLMCPTCQSPLLLFGCDADWPARASGMKRHTRLACTTGRHLFVPNDLRPIDRGVIDARREYLMAHADAVKKRPRAGRYRVYVIELKPKEGASATPRPVIYVGQTSLTVEERLKQHLEGTKASSVVTKRGNGLLYDMFDHLPVMRTQSEALGLEHWWAELLRSQGWNVEGGH